MKAAVIAGLVTMVAAIYGLSWLAHRHEKAVDRLLSTWWGVPTVLLGTPVTVLGLAIGVAALFA